MTLNVLNCLNCPFCHIDAMGVMKCGITEGKPIPPHVASNIVPDWCPLTKASRLVQLHPDVWSVMNEVKTHDHPHVVMACNTKMENVWFYTAFKTKKAAVKEFAQRKAEGYKVTMVPIADVLLWAQTNNKQLDIKYIAE